MIIFWRCIVVNFTALFNSPWPCYICMSTFSNNLKACNLLCSSATTIKGQHFQAMAPGHRFFRTRLRLSVFKVAQKTFEWRIYQMFSQSFTNFSTNLSKIEQQKKKTNFLLVQNNFFSQFVSWKRIILTIGWKNL